MVTGSLLILEYTKQLAYLCLISMGHGEKEQLRTALRELCATLIQLCSKRDCSELRAPGLLHTQLAHGVRSAFTIGTELLLSVLFCYCSTA